MDKTAIKNYAVSARRKLIKAVRQKASELYIFINEKQIKDEISTFQIDGIFLTREQIKSCKPITSYIESDRSEIESSEAYQNAIEEIAYVWFSRLIALRFMEVNDFLPSGIRILSSVNADSIEPDVIHKVSRLDYINQTKANKLYENSSEALYKYILVSQCDELYHILPHMFKRIDDYTELLLPDDLYSERGIVCDLVNSIKEEDFKGQVEIIGWLYQYYMSEKKESVFASLKKNVKMTKENIPVATQLFTPKWIVKYMVENSLGRLWYDSTGDMIIKKNWKYYIDEVAQPEEVREYLANFKTRKMNVEEIKVFDPCMGSGHILVYVFDVMYQIYLSCGYTESDISNLILMNNIYGLDIDDRVGKLAYFSLMMKARSYNYKFFKQQNIPQPMVYSMVEPLDSVDLFLKDRKIQDKDKQQVDNLVYLVKLFSNSKEYGSIVKIERNIDFEKLEAFLNESVERYQESDEYEKVKKYKDILSSMLVIAKNLVEKYDVVITNPPYMCSKRMGAKLSEYIKKEYQDSKSDMFAVFIEKCGEVLKQNGFQAMITQHAWMFLLSYRELRNKLMKTDVVNMLHLGTRAFEEIDGDIVQTAAFVIRKSDNKGYKATYIRLVDLKSQQMKESAFMKGENRFFAKKENYENIFGKPLAYWASTKIIDIFEKAPLLENIANPRQGLATGDNSRFVRLWFEVDFCKCGFGIPSRYDACESRFKWYPYNKGGEFRKWYGNNEYLVNWENDGQEICNFKNEMGKIRSRPQNTKFYFRPSITWSFVSANFGARYSPKGAIFDVAGSSVFPSEGKMHYLLGLLCSKLSTEFMLILNPTVNFQVGNVKKIPIIFSEKYEKEVEAIVIENILISKREWDSFETSWDFKTHPFIQNKVTSEYMASAGGANETQNTIQSAYERWDAKTKSDFIKLKSNEERLNYIFIEIYGLQDELTSKVTDKDITIRKAELVRDVKSFISYAVGCIFGRYSIDEEGLIFAGGMFDISRYKSFIPKEDNIVPMAVDDYFEDDIVKLFISFVSKVYGNEKLEKNLKFIAEVIYPNTEEDYKDKIRRYFFNDFFCDHIKIYKKRPIYWIFDSGKRGTFKALIYMHRYDNFTVERVRMEYLQMLKHRYEFEIESLRRILETIGVAKEKEVCKKKIESIQSKIKNCDRYDQVIAYIAHQKIELDLDAGISVNYEKFQNVTVPEIGKMSLLGKI